jgi:hypothetical protein
MNIDTSLQQLRADVHTDEYGDSYLLCHRENEADEDASGETLVEWRFYFNGRTNRQR